MDPEAMVEFLLAWVVVVDDILICENGMMWDVLLLLPAVGDMNRTMGRRLV